MRDKYTSESIEVLSGLDPVRKRPGMYTDTTKPNHLAQEVIDNSVDEALAGFAKKIIVTLHKDQSLTVTDNGRGMPTDVHPEYKISGVELILTRLHAGGKFSNKSYQFSGGLHGVGISVVNALSSKLEISIHREGEIFQMAFENGHKTTELIKTGSCHRRITGTTVHFWPNEAYFDTYKFSVSRLLHNLRAKAVLCPKLLIQFNNEQSNDHFEWYYEDGLTDYLHGVTYDYITIPEKPFTASMQGKQESVDWAVIWLPEDSPPLTESYVNLIPTTQGGTHVNGLRNGLAEGMREFVDIRNLLPKGVKLSSEDVWENCSYVISLKMLNPQFSGQTKERLSSRECSSFISGVVKDTFSLWLNEHTKIGEKLAEICIQNAQKRMRQAKKISRKKVTHHLALPGKLTDCVSQDNQYTELFLVEGDSAGGSAKQARDRKHQAILPLRGKILNTWEVDSNQVLASQEIHDIAVALGIDPMTNSLDNLRYGKVCILADADSDGLHIATLLCALFIKHFRLLVEKGHLYVAMPPLYRIDVGKKVYYALDNNEKESILDRIHADKNQNKVSIQRFKGLGEMNPKQLRETTMASETRRLIQLTSESPQIDDQMLDLLLAKKRSSDRRTWLESKGDIAQV